MLSLKILRNTSINIKNYDKNLTTIFNHFSVIDKNEMHIQLKNFDSVESKIQCLIEEVAFLR